MKRSCIKTRSYTDLIIQYHIYIHLHWFKDEKTLTSTERVLISSHDLSMSVTLQTFLDKFYKSNICAKNYNCIFSFK